MLDKIVERRRALHRIPELGFDLPETRSCLLSYIDKWGAPVESVAGSGLAVFFDAGREKTALFRSDMDALPVSEPEGAFASVHPGKMHACGHDGHMAMLLSLGDWLNDNRASLKRNALLIFQPSEETGGGGRVVARSGILKRRFVDRAFALHVDPMLSSGTLTSRPGAFMASSCEVHARFTGRSAHAARSEEGRDALMAAAEFVTRAVSEERAMPGEIPRLLKFGILRSGTAVNVIAGEAEVDGTLRTFDDTVFSRMRDMLRKQADIAQARYGVKIEVIFDDGYPALINDEKLYLEAESALSDFDFTMAQAPCMLSEDFSFYGEGAPILMLHLGIGTGHPLHSREFTLDERALVTGAKALIRLAQL